jgi:hypothetical protein
MPTCEIVITNVIKTGTAFAVTLGANPESVFVPAKVAEAAKAAIGDHYVALLVPNSIKPDRTPWMAARIDTSLLLTALAQQVPAADATTADRVREVMRNGGVWTNGKLFDDLFPGKTRGDSAREYSEVLAALHAMFAEGLCAKFQLWRKGDEARPNREWFTCYPERADVDEWVEE